MILAVDCETNGPDFFHGCRPFMITACNGTHEWCWEGEVDPNNREVHWNDSVLASVQQVLMMLNLLYFIILHLICEHYGL
jgi:hypothetical protein